MTVLVCELLLTKQVRTAVTFLALAREVPTVLPNTVNHFHLFLVAGTWNIALKYYRYILYMLPIINNSVHMTRSIQHYVTPTLCETL